VPVVPVVWVFDFILLPLLARRLLRMVPLFMVPVLFIVPEPFIVPVPFMVPVPVPIVPLFIVPVPMVPVPGVVVPDVVPVVGLVCAKAALAQRAKAAARKREVAFMTKVMGGVLQLTSCSLYAPPGLDCYLIINTIPHGYLLSPTLATLICSSPTHLLAMVTHRIILLN